MSKVNALYHIVFCTKYRQMTIPEEHKNDLYRYIWSILTHRNCHLLRMGGIGNHIHMLINLSPNVALADLVRDIKAKSSHWLVADARFPHFQYWAKEYFAATISASDVGRVSEYIKSQELHHGVTPFDDELRELCRSEGLTLRDDDLV